MTLQQKTQQMLLLVITEFLRWAVIVIAVYLSVWQYGSVHEYAIFIPGVDILAQFWGIFTAIMVAIFLAIYLPWRVLSVKLRTKYNIIRDERWRPAIAVYIIICAAPCFTLVLCAYKLEPSYTHIPPSGATVLQLVVMGLVVTEWMVKIQQETFSYQLITAMMHDFFFAFDVIAFVMMSSSTTDSPIYISGAVYACFVFAVVSMFKYVPTQPLSFAERGSSLGHVVCLVTSIFCNDLPFVVIRLATMIIFGFLISDLIFVLKNVFAIIFHCIQLVAISQHLKRSPPLLPDDDADDDVEAMDASMPDMHEGPRPQQQQPQQQTAAPKPRPPLSTSPILMMDKREFRCGNDVWCQLREAVRTNRINVSSDEPTVSAAVTSTGNQSGV